MDDCLTGADSVPEACALQKELCDLLGQAGMTLRKWRSNSSALLDTIPENLREIADLHLPSGPSANLKTLGIHWDSVKDQFFIAVPTVDPSTTPTN